MRDEKTKNVKVFFFFAEKRWVVFSFFERKKLKWERCFYVFKKFWIQKPPIID